MRATILVLSMVGLASYAQAAEKRSLDAHEHGVGNFNIAIEGKAVEIEFTAPGADIVGFEHVAESAGDRKKVDAAIAALAKPMSLFRLPDDAKCTLVAAEVELHDEEDEAHEKHDKDDHDHGHDKDHAKHDDHKHDDHKHEDAHKKDDHDDHDHKKAEHKDDHDHGHDKDHAKHDDHKHAEANHTEFHAEYRLNCAAPQAIDRIVFDYFSVFPNAEELEVQLVSDKGAKGFEVERANPVLELNGLI